MLFSKVVVDTFDSSEVQLNKDNILFRNNEAFTRRDKIFSMFLKLRNHVAF